MPAIMDLMEYLNEESVGDVTLTDFYSYRLHVVSKEKTCCLSVYSLIQEKEEERERQRAYYIHMKEYMKPREDLECEDQKVSLSCLFLLNKRM